MDHSIQNPKPLTSIWESFASEINFAALDADITTEVAIIGGGITGISTAQLLKEAGFNVVVVEAMKVGQANTGHSTGNLYVAIEEGFDLIQSKYDTETLQTVIRARKEAIDLIEQNVTTHSIDCDFKRQPWISYSTNKANDTKIEKIYDAAVDAGLEISKVGEGELPFEFTSGIRIENQAQYNPLRYVQQLAGAIDGSNCKIYEDTRVESIDENDDKIIIKTTGGTITAKYAIHATHTPKGIFLDFHSLLGTYREYGIAARLAGADYPQGTFWGYYNVNDRFSIRTYEHDGEKRIIVVGQPHEVGLKENNQENIQNLEKFLREHFEVSEITNQWGGQNYKPADGLPYIGRKGKNSNVFVATGFSTDGLVYGALSGIIIRDMLVGQETEYTKLFDATRHNPLKAAEKFIKENTINAVEVLKDYLLINDTKLSDIAVSEGKIVEMNGKKLAVYHQSQGVMKACSAICPHMGCVVHWNSAEKTWDCPCHASRFTTDGAIIEGPALTPLQRIIVRKDGDF